MRNAVNNWACVQNRRKIEHVADRHGQQMYKINIDQLSICKIHAETIYMKLHTYIMCKSYLEVRVLLRSWFNFWPLVILKFSP